VAGRAEGFVWRVAVPAVKERFLPDSISTDLHVSSMNAGMKDMLNVMSKFLAMGLSLDDVVQRATSNAARAIKQKASAISPSALPPTSPFCEWSAAALVSSIRPEREWEEPSGSHAS
jgi:hypothetical protein